MMRRVDMRSSFSELERVKVQHEALIEEHLGVSNRNLWRVDLDRIPLLEGKSIEMFLCTCRVIKLIIWVVPRNVSFRPFV